MGICLSCLRPNDDDDHLNENTPLLHDSKSDQDKIENLRKRQEELDKIVNETSEQLIDVTTFFNTTTLSGSNNNNIGTSPSLTLIRVPLNGQLQDKSQLNELQLKAIDNFGELTDEEMKQFTQINDQLLQQIKNEIRLNKPGPLLADF